MAKRFFGAKNITHILYGLIMLLPMFSILARVIYIQANPNAKDSYSGTTTTYQQVEKYQTNELNSNADFVFGNIYHFDNYVSIYDDYYFSVYDNISIQFISVVNIDLFTFFGNGENTFESCGYDDCNYLSLYFDVGTNYMNVVVTTAFTDLFVSYIIEDNEKDSNYSFDFVYTDEYVLPTTDFYLACSSSTYQEYEYIAVEQSTLDNAFDYSLNSFITDNNMGNIDMFGWFTNLFLNGVNPVNALYIGFVNWYLNYALLVSSGYLIFMVLIWFINFVRKIMDKSMYQDYGGF